MDLAAQLAEVDRLRALEFPARRVTSTAVRSGPGYHLADLADLAVSADADAPDDGDVGRRQAAADDFEAGCQALVEHLARRWGEPRPLDLYPYLVRREKGDPVPPPLDMLCGHVSEVYGWTVDDRWIGLGVGQGERGLPVPLVLAVGESRAVPGSAPLP